MLLRYLVPCSSVVSMPRWLRHIVTAGSCTSELSFKAATVNWVPQAHACSVLQAVPDGQTVSVLLVCHLYTC